MTKMNNVKKSIVAALLIEIILKEYKAGELNKAGELVKKRIGKYLRQRYKSNPKEFLEASQESYKAWKDALDHFAEQKINIEAKSMVMEFYNYFENVLSKYAKLSDKHIENFMQDGTDNAEAEHNSGIVVEYIVDKLGLQTTKNPLHTRLVILKQNMIIDGK